ncbi:hypothetical protein [Halomonas sp. NO4]|uniref:hypothetical protein n=1 Tax=Halomonas sp. NO4 TaxID=2484813 RepID=UPI0013D0C7FE|nr:hypothetical protein [Halomonas sp. NO4]
MTTRLIRDDRDKARLVRWIEGQEPPFTASLAKGSLRSLAQNRLLHQWFRDAAEQGDMTAQEYRAQCKLHFGVPILREESDGFREKYDRLIKPRLYEEKLEFMVEPFDFPVTRLMTARQFRRFLDTIHEHFTGLGFELTDPRMLGIESLMEVA